MPSNLMCGTQQARPLGSKSENMVPKYRLFLSLSIWVVSGLLFASQAFAQKKDSPSKGENEKLTLVQAAICEGIQDNSPKNRAIVFSLTSGRVHCFTTFDPVPEKTVIYHKWYFRDKPRATIKLSLQTPRWSSFSRIRLRDDEKGPWRVEITDEEGNIFRILRFSVTD